MYKWASAKKCIPLIRKAFQRVGLTRESYFLRILQPKMTLHLTVYSLHFLFNSVSYSVNFITSFLSPTVAIPILACKEKLLNWVRLQNLLRVSFYLVKRDRVCWIYCELTPLQKEALEKEKMIKSLESEVEVQVRHAFVVRNDFQTGFFMILFTVRVYIAYAFYS